MGTGSTVSRRRCRISSRSGTGLNNLSMPIKRYKIFLIEILSSYEFGTSKSDKVILWVAMMNKGFVVLTYGIWRCKHFRYHTKELLLVIFLTIGNKAVSTFKAMSAEDARKEVLALMDQKDRMEAEIQELTSVLERVRAKLETNKICRTSFAARSRNA